jgi:hypothetical protein
MGNLTWRQLTENRRLVPNLDEGRRFFTGLRGLTQNGGPRAVSGVHGESAPGWPPRLTGVGATLTG